MKNFFSHGIKQMLLKLLLLVTAFSFSACLKTRTDVKETETKQVMQQQVVTLQRTNADTNSRLSDLDEQIRELSGKIETLENKISKMNPEHDKTVKNLAEMQIDSSKKLTLLQEEITKQEAQLLALNSEIQALKANAQTAAVEKTPEATKKNTFQGAEDLYKQGEWKKAIIQFQKYRDENPKGKHFSESTYKMALSFQELGMKDEAKAFLEEVITKSPNSAEAKKAKQKLKTLKK
jgi:TolA-binding protein